MSQLGASGGNSTLAQSYATSSVYGVCIMR